MGELARTVEKLHSLRSRDQGETAAYIAPDFPVELIGGGWENPVTTEVYSPLSSQALVFDDAGRRSAVITIDRLGLTPWLTRDIQERVAAAVATRPELVMVTFSHTHSAPFPLSETGGKEYLALLTDRVVGAARSRLAEQAEEIAREAQIRFGIDGTNWLAECGRLREADTYQQTQEILTAIGQHRPAL